MKQTVDDLDNSTISILGLFLRIPISKNKYLTPHSHTHEPFFSTPTQAELPACQSLHPIQNQSRVLALALCIYLYVHSILYMHIASALGRESESVRMRVCARPSPWPIHIHILTLVHVPHVELWSVIHLEALPKKEWRVP